MRIKIREMTSVDWTEVSHIYQAGIDTGIATFQTACPSFEAWDTSHLKDCRLVAELEGHVVGWTALTAVSSRCVYNGVAEMSIYVDTHYSCRGIGETLLNALIRQSEANGFWTLQSGIMRENTASIRLHDKCGFRMVGYREKIGCDQDGIWRDTVLMERRSTLDQFCGK